MQSRPVIIVGLFLATVALALLAGIGAGKAYKNLSPTEEDLSLGSLPPLPDWVGEPLPDFADFATTQERKDAFFDYLFPRVALANQRVLTLRQRVEALAAKQTLTAEDEAFLAQEAERLRIDAPVGSKELFEMLIRRLDMIPPSLVLAQAANESAWGTSRFARQGNNLFGQWCFSQGCGMVPSGRADGARHEVARFDTPYQSVRSYIANLNRHPSYQELRLDRAQLRAQKKTLSGQALAPGLQAYSERGEAYIDEIIDMMRFNRLQRYDRRFGEWLETDAQSTEPYVLLATPNSVSDLN